MANNKFMDITKWKKVVSKAKHAQKYLDKVSNWEEGDKDYDDDVSNYDAWNWGCNWLGEWFDTIEVNGLYELNGKKIHIIHKEFCNNNRDFSLIETKPGLASEIDKWGFGGTGIMIDDNDGDYTVHKTWFFVVANIDGVYNLILPSKEGCYKPLKRIFSRIDKSKDCDEVNFEGDIDEMIEDNWDKNVNWLSCGISSDNIYDYDISWANMKRIA